MIIFLIFMIIFIAVMIIFIIVILFFVQKKQRGFTHDLNAVKSNYEKELYRAQLEIQEQTLQEIGREIHDNVGQILSLAKMSLGALDLDRKKESKESIADISEILDKALADLRHLSRTINTDIIKSGGLIKSIEIQVAYIQRGGKFKIQLDLNGVPVLLKETKEIILFRIVQEALNNILRHATADEIAINLSYDKDFLCLQIRDNGKGFNLNEQIAANKTISGIYNMQNRAKIIDAEFVLDSEIGQGTCITVKTPY